MYQYKYTSTITYQRGAIANTKYATILLTSTRNSNTQHTGKRTRLVNDSFTSLVSLVRFPVQSPMLLKKQQVQAVKRN